MAEEPSLPQLPDSVTSNSRKRGHMSSLNVSDASSDPALFSSDDDPGLDNYVEGRRKRRYLGSWFHQRPVSPDSAVDVIKMPPPQRRALTRHPDSGVFLGSDGSDSSDLPDFQCIPPRARLPLPARKISPAEELAREKIRACVESGTQDVDLVSMGLDEISEETVSILANVQVFPTVRPDVAFEQRDPRINFFLGNNRLTRLPGAIFDLQHLTTLSLRNNELTEISPAIVKLTNLKELNLGQNQLRSFPSEILRLLLFGKLKRFFWGPNPLYQPDCNLEFPVLDVSACHRAEYSNLFLGRSPLQERDSMGRVTSCFSLPELDSKDDVPLHKSDRGIGLGDMAEARKGVPSLMELCLRSGHRSSMTADLPLHMPDELDHLRRLLQRMATQKATGRLNCSSCGRLIVIPQAEWIEWHELRDRKPILPVQCSVLPFRYLACSRGCWPDVQLPPVPSSPVYSVASTAHGGGGASQFTLPAPPVPRPAHAVLAKADLERSHDAYTDLVISAKAYRLALASLSEAASAFGAALEACARLKEARADPIGPMASASSSSSSAAASSAAASGAANAAAASSSTSSAASASRGCTADPLLSASGVHYLVANHQQILSETVYRAFEVPLLHDLDRWRSVIEDEQATYQNRISAQTKEVKRLEREGLKLHRQRRRDVGRFRAHLVDLTAKLDGLTTLHADHARSLLRESQETSSRIVDASCSLVRAEVDIFESLARKGWCGGGLDDLLDRGRDLFAADDDAIAHPPPDPAKLFSILPHKSILADSADSLPPPLSTNASLNTDEADADADRRSSAASVSTITAEANRPRNQRPFSPQPIRRIPTDVTYDSLAALAAPGPWPSSRPAERDNDDDEARGRSQSLRPVTDGDEEGTDADK
ncbi:hypothetical protein CDD80_1425 [Ophiocordyceps camponoti-rufipedis]|uniref:Uncharacterized protein n=1 Tax=Ophiocordyceps camponoti-rufipedis TaxID=2004952 RepID=A0A2C5ZAX8_9HYPO|nr:hypothetical protein CDD80_1425 [Ophiocordyceps camponoti-rufipedis]